MDQCEQLDVDDKDQLIECDSELIAGWSSSRRKVESVAEKVAWSSVALVSGDADCELGGDSCGDLNSKVGVTSAVIEASSSKWLSDQQITESFVDDRVDDGEGGSLIVVNRSARRMETHTESIVTRKVRSRIIEIDDGDDFDDQEGEGGFFEEEQLISALSSSSIDDQSKENDSNSETNENCSNIEQSESPIQQSPISSLIKSCESESTTTLSLTKSCWSSTITESIESVDESFIGQTNEDESIIETTIGLESENDDNIDDDDVVNDDDDEKHNKLNQQVWSRIEKIRDEKLSSSSLLLSSSKAHNHQVWSSVHSESVESTESTEFISTLSSSEINESKLISDNYDYDKDEDEDNDDNSNINSREISRCNSNEENDDNDDESIESDNEVAISIRRPSLSLVKAEAFVFRSRRSLEELETEIVIRKKRKPKVNKEMDETATIFIANCDSTAIKETSSSLSPSSSSSSLPLSSLSMRAIPENRRDNLMESFNKHGSLDTETDSNEDDDEIISEQLDEQSTNCFDHVDKLSQLAGDRFDWNCSPITTVFKSDREINDLF